MGNNQGGMNVKKNLIFILLFLTIILSVYGISQIAGSSGIKIEQYIADIELKENGDMLVKESWTYLYPSGYTVRYRDLAYDKYDPYDPLTQSRQDRAFIDRENVKVRVYDGNGNPIPTSKYEVKFSGQMDERGEIIECEPDNPECLSVFVRMPEGMPRTVTFDYEYLVEGAITKYKDVAELNWVLLEYFEATIQEAKVTVTLPNIPALDIMVWGHGLSDGNIRPPEDSKVIMDINKIKKGEILEFRVLMPANKFSVEDKNYVAEDMRNVIINYEQKLAEETNRRIVVAQIVFYGTFAMLAIMLFIVYRAYIKYDKEHQPKFTGKYYRELPADYSPAEMSYLYYFRKINDEDLTATILDLIRRKYLILDENNQGINKKDANFKLILNREKNLSELKSHESHLITWFINGIGNGKEVTLNQIENYPKQGINNANNFRNQAAGFVRKAKNEGMNHDFFEKRIGIEKRHLLTAVFIPIIYLFIAFVLNAIFNIEYTFTVIASILAGILYVIYISSIDKRSINGNEDYAKWKAFKEFLLDFGNMKDYPIPGIVVWEHYLVYATSLKVADKVMEQLQVKLPELVEAEGLGTSTYLAFGYYHPRYRYWYAWSSINRSIYTARQNQFQTIASYNASKVSGVGRGGGFGGGRSFGGGGGGSRSR
ncbi:MAG: DUF2207 domain-containing protein [Acholeplasmataceae bacterium]|nr:DUF2207 domain-containing protein [Acholeplasmataceae bacterium]